MKTHKHIGKIAGITLLLLMLAAPLAAASAMSDNIAIANDRTQSSDNRMKAILDLGASGNENAAPTLLRILKGTSEEQRIRTSAVLALENLGTPRLTIIRALETAYSEADAGKNFRYTILLTLGKMKAVESMTLLTGALSGSDSMIRIKAYQALGALESIDALQVMARYLKTEDDYMVRAAAVRASGQSQSTAAETILVKALRTDSAPLVRYNAVIVLGQFTTLSADAKTALEAAKNDESSVVRNAAKGVLP